jgi:hypothetical protein
MRLLLIHSFWQYDQSFYEFFRKYHLQTLSSAETFQLFHHSEFGNKLQEQYKPLYYACQILNGKANEENNLMLRIPPELDSTVKIKLRNCKSFMNELRLNKTISQIRKQNGKQ